MTASPGLQNPLSSPGTKLKLMPAAKSRLQHPHGALQLTQPSAIPKPTPRDTEMESNSAPASCLMESWEAWGD